ncbi:tetratricopeptide repeat protein [Desulfosarcina sp.]|nr:tetratricopeptide repeat protein [Desulfosarcina sp.]
MINKLIITIITVIAIVVSNPIVVYADSSLSSLEKQYSDCKEDTTRVKLLFEMGNLFINGPSDSLLFYYGKALEIIQQNLNEYLKNEDANQEIIKVYRYFEIRAWIEFGIENFFQSDYSKALSYYFNALEAARFHGDVGLISECNSEIGIVYKNQGKFDLALQYYEQALEQAKQTTDTSWVASCQINIGNVYKEKGYLTIAQKYYMEALVIVEELGHERRVSACYQNIGDVYNKQRDYNIALEYYSRSLELAKKTNDKVREMICYLNIAYVYVNMAQYRIARGYLNKAIVLYDETGYQHELDNCYILMGDTYLDEKDFTTAIDYYNRALKLSRLENDKTSIAEIEGKLGTAYMEINDNQKALQYFISSLEVADTIGSLLLMLEANARLSQFYEDANQLGKAIHYHKEHDRLKDSLFNAEKYRAIMEMEVKYNSEKKEQELALLKEKHEVQKLKLNRRNRVYITSLIGISLLLVIIYVLFRNRQLKAVHRSIELEQKLMRSQMNPHFIFNSLIAIQSYIYKKEAVKAGDYLARFAELIRITLENSREEFVLLAKEIKMLNAYLELQELRFENKFDYQIETGQGMDTSSTMIPPMMAQPFIENAIEHGLRHKSSKGYVKITFRQEIEFIECTVEDNGVGREKSKELSQRKEHKSMATSITTERLKILSKKAKQKFTFEIIDIADQTSATVGTRVIFSIPFRKI